jgi:hypothetical protein
MATSLAGLGNRNDCAREASRNLPPAATGLAEGRQPASNEANTEAEEALMLEAVMKQRPVKRQHSERACCLQ